MSTHFLDVMPELPESITVQVGDSLCFVSGIASVGAPSYRGVRADSGFLQSLSYPAVIGFHLSNQPLGTRLYAGFKALKPGTTTNEVQLASSVPGGPAVSSTREVVVTII